MTKIIVAGSAGRQDDSQGEAAMTIDELASELPRPMKRGEETVHLTARPVPSLRSIALPAEHGGWGFLLEPILLALLVAPSGTGVLIALAFGSGFLARQPLKFALQDLFRGKSYPRTGWCWKVAAAYGGAAASALAAAVYLESPAILNPLGLVAPLAIIQILYDASGRSRSLFAELCGATAMTSSAAAIAIAGGMQIAGSFALAGVAMARLIPAIVYVRTLVTRSHGREASSLPPLALHAAAAFAVAAFAPVAATVAMIVLFARAAWGLTHKPLPAKSIGWREIGFGAMTVAMAAGGVGFWILDFGFWI